jgi:hypothetical protein
MARSRVSDETPDLYGEMRERIYRESEGRARAIIDAAKTCTKCGLSMLGWPGRTVHYSCDPELPLAGRRCSCAPGCSDKYWGNGKVECDPSCEPCKTMRGQPLSGKRKG